MKTLNFKQLRMKSNQTVYDVAEKIGISVNTYRKYECYARLPKTANISKLMEAYKCTADDILIAIENHKYIHMQKRKKCKQ